MDQETLYTAAKWEILKVLATEKKSPIELAESANTSVSNISQSLRFLELAGIVKSERLGNRDKGQPRVVYSLASDNAFIILTAKNFVDKKQIKVDTHKKALLKIWFYENESLHQYIEQGFLNIEENLGSIKGIFLNKNSVSEIKLHIVQNDSSKKEFKEITAKYEGISKKVKYVISTEESIRKDPSSHYAIYDPQKILEDKKGQ